MKQKRLTIVAIACGAVCALCVFAFMGTVQGEANAARAEALARYGGEQIDVCVAARDIAAGERVDASAVETKLWVADLLPEGAISESAEVVGRTASSPILKGEVLSSQRFEQARDALEVPAGKAAISVPAKTVRAVGGALRPGMFVDIYATGDSAATAIAQAVPVLATSSGDGGALGSDASWITIALDPGKVQEMVTASSRYDLYFVLPGTEEALANDAAAAEGAASAAEDATGTSADVAAAADAAPATAAESSDSATPDESADADQATSEEEQEAVDE